MATKHDQILKHIEELPNELEWLFWDLSKRLLVAHPLVPSCNYRQLVRTLDLHGRSKWDYFRSRR
jgi:hypothetical protein